MKPLFEISFFLLIVAFYFIFGGELYNFILGILTALIILFPLLRSQELRQNAFHPYSYFLFNAVLFFILPIFVITWLAKPGTPVDQTTELTLLITASFAMFWFGYQSRIGQTLSNTIPLLYFPKSTSRKQTEKSETKIIFIVLLFYLLGWTGRIVAAKAGISHLPNQESAAWQWKSLIVDLGQFASFSYVLLLYFIFQKIKHSGSTLANLLIAILLVLAEIFGGAMDGGRTAIMLPLLYLLFVYSIVFSPIHFTTLVIMYLTALLVVGPVLTIYRISFYAQVQSEESQSVNIITVVDSVVDGMLYIDSHPTVMKNITENTLGRITIVYQTALRVLDRVPSRYDYEWGKEVVGQLSTVFIPRALWPDKPIYLTGRKYKILFWDGSGGFDETGTSVGAGMLGDAYFNFSWFGICLFLVVGTIFRFLVERCRLYWQIENISRVLRLFFVLFVMANLSATLTTYVVGSIRTAIVYFAFLSLINFRLPQIKLGYYPIFTQRIMNIQSFSVNSFTIKFSKSNR